MKYYYRQKYIKNARKIVLKLGTRVLMSEKDGMDREPMARLVEDICDFRKRGYSFCIVSSGAVGFGMEALKLHHRPGELKKVQANASIGQCILMQKWISMFREKGIPLGQILLTYDIIENRKRFLYARDCIQALIEYGAIPVINENDSVAVDEIKFGDNDTLSALTSHLMGADLLILYTDTDGVYTRNPHRHPDAERISLIERVDQSIFDLIEDKANHYSVGGMKSKLMAAELSAKAGTGVVITNGRLPKLRDLLEGEDIGTFVKPDRQLVKEKKRWIFFNRRIKGKIFIDEGAENALLNMQKSLLPGGIVKTEKEFPEGSIVGIFNTRGEMIGKGISYYSRKEIDRIKGLRTDQIRSTKEKKYYDEIIHRDNMIIF